MLSNVNCTVAKRGKEMRHVQFTCSTPPQIYLLHSLLASSPVFGFVFGATAPQWAKPSSFPKFPDHTQRRTTVGRTPLDQWSARGRDLYLTTHNTHKRQTSMPLVGFEPTISAGERPQTYVLARVATGTGVSSGDIPKWITLSQQAALVCFCMHMSLLDLSCRPCTDYSKLVNECEKPLRRIY